MRSSRRRRAPQARSQPAASAPPAPPPATSEKELELMHACRIHGSGGERRGDTAGAGDRERCVGLVGCGGRRARQGGRQAGAAGGGGAGAGPGDGEEARPHRGGQGAESAQASAAEPRVGAAGPGAEEGVPDGTGGEGQGPRAPQCRARAAGLHPPEREQHAPPDTEEHDGARGQAGRRRRRQGGRQRQEAPFHQELMRASSRRGFGLCAAPASRK